MERFMTLIKGKTFGVPNWVFVGIVAIVVFFFAMRYINKADPIDEESEEDIDIEGDPEIGVSNPRFEANDDALAGVDEEQFKRLSNRIDDLQGEVNQNVQTEEEPDNDKFSGPPTRQGRAPTTHTVRSKKDNDYRELALLYYGSNRWDFANRIRGHQKNIGLKKGPFPVGTKVYIPKFDSPKWFKATSRHRHLHAIARKNGVSAARVMAMNPGFKWPVKVGQRVRVG